MIEKENMQIDELIQSRLRNESDNGGIHQAWNKMQAMLDNDNDKKPVAFWKKGWILPMVLFTIISGAGAGFWHFNNDNGTTENEMAKDKMLASNKGVSTRIDNPIVDPVATSSQEATEIITSKDKPTTDAKVANHNNNNSQHATDKVSNIKPSSSPKKGNQFIVSSNIKKNKTAAKSQSENANNAGQRMTVNSSGKATLITDNPMVNAGMNSAIVNQDKNAKNQNTKKIKTVQNRMIKDAAEGELFVDTKNDNLITRKKTINQKTYTIIEKSKKQDEKIVRYLDTINHGYQPIVKYIPLEEIEILALQHGLAIYVTDVNQQMQPISITTYKDGGVAEPEMLVSAATITGKGAKLSKSGGTEAILKDLNQFFEIRKQFYTNVFGGFNSSVSNLFPFGFQAGIGLHYWMSDQWSVGSELGYVFRPMNHTFVDEAATFTQIGDGVPVVGGTRFNYKEQKISKHYNFSYVQAFEVPLLFTYHNDRWSMYGGPSVSFAMPIRYQKTEMASAQDKIIVQNNIAENLDMPSTMLRSTPDDFKTNIGFGAVLGLHYNLNHKFSMNLRYSQVIKDNALTEVGQELSGKMFRSPSLRLGIVYKLGKENSVQYLMDHKQK